VLVPTFLLAASLAGPEMIPLEIFEATTVPSSPNEMSLDLRDGGTFRMGDYRGKPIILAFWASWCSPCRRELPALDAFAIAHPEVYILAVNVDRERPDAETFLERVHFGLPVAFDPESRILGRYGVTSMPTMLLYDREGALQWQHSGYGEDKGFEELSSALRGAR
jgi:thiol-disulfide isomerase/thioredoxin